MSDQDFSNAQSYIKRAVGAHDGRSPSSIAELVQIAQVYATIALADDVRRARFALETIRDELPMQSLRAARIAENPTAPETA